MTREERIATVRAAGPPHADTPDTAQPGHAQRCWCGGRRYMCPGCRRFVLECNGQADDSPELCDDCWGVLVGATA